MKKVISTTNKNYSIDNKLRKLKDNYTKNLKNINSQRDEIMKLIKINNQEIEYYKLVNDELIKEYKNYYFSIMINDYDSREEGLVWAVMRLLEIDTNLEYCHFPKFLTHAQDDFLIKIGKLLLEETQLKIILKALKKKQLKL